MTCFNQWEPFNSIGVEWNIGEGRQMRRKVSPQIYVRWNMLKVSSKKTLLSKMTTASPIIFMKTYISRIITSPPINFMRRRLYKVITVLLILFVKTHILKRITVLHIIFMETYLLYTRALPILVISVPHIIVMRTKI